MIVFCIKHQGLCYLFWAALKSLYHDEKACGKKLKLAEILSFIIFYQNSVEFMMTLSSLG